MLQDGREEVRDEERFGRERDVRTPDLVDKIGKFLDEDCRISLFYSCCTIWSW